MSVELIGECKFILLREVRRVLMGDGRTNVLTGDGIILKLEFNDRLPLSYLCICYLLVMVPLLENKFGVEIFLDDLSIYVEA